MIKKLSGLLILITLLAGLLPANVVAVSAGEKYNLPADVDKWSGHDEEAICFGTWRGGLVTATGRKGELPDGQVRVEVLEGDGDIYHPFWVCEDDLPSTPLTPTPTPDPKVPPTPEPTVTPTPTPIPTVGLVVSLQWKEGCALPSTFEAELLGAVWKTEADLWAKWGEWTGDTKTGTSVLRFQLPQTWIGEEIAFQIQIWKESRTNLNYINSPPLTWSGESLIRFEFPGCPDPDNKNNKD